MSDWLFSPLQWLTVTRLQLLYCDTCFPIVDSMEASAGDAMTGRRHVWRTTAARVLHNQVGHAFRRAAAASKKSKCWDHGWLLAGRVAKWCKVLDDEIVSDLHGYRPSTLEAHISDATTAAPEGSDGGGTDADYVSCATTAEWARQRRKPRHRPGRREARASRMRDMQDITARLASESASEVDYELGIFPLQAFGLLATCLEEDVEEGGAEQHCGSEVLPDSSEHQDDSNKDVADPCLLHSGSTAPDSKSRVEASHAASTHSVSPSVSVAIICPQRALGGHKRKLDEVEFAPVDREEVLEQAVEQAAVRERKRIEEMTQFNSAAFVAQSRILLRGLRDTLVGPCPSTPQEVVQLHACVEESLKRLSKLILSPGAHAQLAVDIIRHLREEVLADDCGIRRWIAQTATDLTDFGNLDEEDRTFFFRYLGEEMLEHSMSVDYHLDQIDEFVSLDEQL